MAIVDVVSQLPTGGPVAQVWRLYPNIGSHCWFGGVMVRASDL